jgi:hypothetical protein
MSCEVAHRKGGRAVGWLKPCPAVVMDLFRWGEAQMAPVCSALSLRSRFPTKCKVSTLGAFIEWESTSQNSESATLNTMQRGCGRVCATPRFLFFTTGVDNTVTHVEATLPASPGAPGRWQGLAWLDHPLTHVSTRASNSFAKLTD